MRSLWGRLVRWLLLQGLSAERMAAQDARLRLQNSIYRLHKTKKKLEQVERRVIELSGTAAEDLEQAEVAARQCELAMEELRAKLEVLEDVTIPTMVAHSEKHLQRLRAEASIEVARQVAMSPADREA